MTTRTLTVPHNDWLDLGTGPLLVTSKSMGVVYLFTSLAKPALTDIGHPLGAALDDYTMRFMSNANIWARGVNREEVIVVSEVGG
jgi:hypothetical protein